MALDMQSIYILASGGSRAMEALDTITNNLANVNTTGFKQMVIKEMSQRLDENGGDARELFVFPRFQESLVQLDQGGLRESGEPLDFAIDGEGFFKLEGPDGPVYTRDGHFFLDQEGAIVDDHGNRVLGRDDNPILLDPTMPIHVDENGQIYQGGEVIGEIAVESFEKMEPIGSNYYRPAGAQQEARYRLKQGFLEGSNVDPLAQMGELITTQRRFEIYGNLIKSLDQLHQKSNEIGKA
ncbi:MAG: flagellar biosynthesis protein FlgF [Nitratiruptor sp.]|nr:flagellar biosynthesis protein FlgF [Nitratiruptor sp.]NPA84252.1 flagellar hook-basal body protein [Campylobacterota bacterium]